MFLKNAGLILRQLINAPVAMSSHFNQTMFFEVEQVFGDFDLGLAQNGLEVTNAEGRLREEIQDAETRLVAKTLINLDQLHTVNMLHEVYTAIGK